jgi:hypothetical protein
MNPRELIVYAFVILFVPNPVALADVFRCSDADGRISYSNMPENAQAGTICTRQGLPPPSVEEIARFQKDLKVGDVAQQGLIIEVKRPIARVQTAERERWYRIDKLLPQPKR